MVFPLHRHDSERTISSEGFILPVQSASHTMERLFTLLYSRALGYSQRGIWSVCCGAGGGDGQTMSDGGTLTEERVSLCSPMGPHEGGLRFEIVTRTLLWCFACRSQIKAVKQSQTVNGLPFFSPFLVLMKTQSRPLYRTVLPFTHSPSAFSANHTVISGNFGFSILPDGAVRYWDRTADFC